MAVQKVNIEKFLELALHYPVIDVRSPAEYKHACIPGAYSLPLFTDEERKVVGTAYKQQSKEKAIKIGLDYIGRKMVAIVEDVEKILESKDNRDLGKPSSKTVLVHCWRGGMRSGGVAWLLDLYGFKVYTLAGGYKVYRQWVLEQFEKDYDFKILGGYTGSGKTEVLVELEKLGKTVINLEALAHHKGSAFGNIGMPAQPTQEMFENKLAGELFKASSVCKIIEDRSKITGEENILPSKNNGTFHEQSIGATLQSSATTFNDQLSSDQSLSSVNSHSSTQIWLEDESQRIGLVNIPVALWKTIRTKPVVFLDIPFEERLKNIVRGYGKGDKEKLLNAIVRIKKRLGGLETKIAVNYLLEDDLKESSRVLLAYYDKWYLKGLRDRDNWENTVSMIECKNTDPVANALKLIELKEENAVK